MENTTGTSMLPSIFPGAFLTVSEAGPGMLEVGDIICYPGDGKTVVAHRIIAVIPGDGMTSYRVRGDAQRSYETVAATAIASKVTRIDQRFWSYDVDGRTGRLFSKLAVRDEPTWRLARRGAARLAFIALGLWRRRHRRRANETAG
jgi:hypothetical protein